MQAFIETVGPATVTVKPAPIEQCLPLFVCFCSQSGVGLVYKAVQRMLDGLAVKGTDEPHADDACALVAKLVSYPYAETCRQWLRPSAEWGKVPQSSKGNADSRLCADTVTAAWRQPLAADLQPLWTMIQGHCRLLTSSTEKTTPAHETHPECRHRSRYR